MHLFHSHCSKQLGKESIAKELIRKGADINLLGPGSYSPLIIANLGGFEEVAEELIRRGADLNTRTVEVCCCLTMCYTIISCRLFYFINRHVYFYVLYCDHYYYCFFDY